MAGENSGARSKLTTERDAIARFVEDGDTIYCGFSMGPMGLAHEVIRQKKRRLNAVGASNVVTAGLLAVAGCSDRMETGYVSGALGNGPVNEMMQDGRLRFEDYSNLVIALRFMAGALGMPFIPGNSFLGTDYLKPEVMNHSHSLTAERTRADGTVAPSYVVMDSPFVDGGKTVLFPALKPDVALFHCQRADEFGNTQAWGPLADSKWALWASRKVIISAEEIVAPSVIRSDPGRTVIPGFRVSAVVHNPWGVHPGPMYGMYARDRTFSSLVRQPFRSWEGAREYLDEWVYGVEDRVGYVRHYAERFGDQLLETLRLKDLIVPEQPAVGGWR